jgi:hypothetical protein
LFLPISLHCMAQFASEQSRAHQCERLRANYDQKT